MISVKLFLASVLSCGLILVTSGCAAMATYWGEPAVQNQEVQAAAPSVIHPTQIVEAERWVQQNSSLKGAQLASEVDKQSWDPSVKALTQFPSVLANMDKNLSWTSAL